MAELGNQLIHLLAGDVVRIECEDMSFRAEVLEHEHDGPTGLRSGATARHTVRFMPFGDDAKAVTADQFHVDVDRAGDDGWVTGPLVAEVFDEDELVYTTESRGELLDVEVLEL